MATNSLPKDDFFNISLIIGHPINKGVVAVNKETRSWSSCDSVTRVVTIDMGTNNEYLALRLGHFMWSIWGGHHLTQSGTNIGAGTCQHRNASK